MTQNRLRSPIVWSAIAAQILALLVTLDLINTGLSDTLNALVASILQLLVTFGVLNDPTRKDTF